jgi:hypothetical protein
MDRIVGTGVCLVGELVDGEVGGEGAICVLQEVLVVGQLVAV